MLAAGTIITLASHSYRLDAPLASSAYGLVWRAATLPAGRAVALKFVNQAQMAQAAPALRQRWIDGAQDELAFLRQLAPWDGRHIVRLLDSGVEDGLPVLALELLGGDLGAWVARRRAAGSMVDPLQALTWIGQVNQALAKVHQYGRRHLDLKPSNLLLSTGYSAVTLKLADFGTSRALADRAPHPYAGTPNWQAPEQLWAAPASDAGNAGNAGNASNNSNNNNNSNNSNNSNNGSHDGSQYLTSAATDYFALGALLYYLITGGVALRFCVDAAHAWRQQHDGGVVLPSAGHTLTDDEAALFVRHCAGLPGADAGAHALRLLRALLAPQPAARPPHALAIGRLLAAALMPAGRARAQASAWVPA